MTDINQMTTLGIGTPADIPHFVLFGLTIQVHGAVDVTLHERLFGIATLDDRDIATGLFERKFGGGTLDDKP